MAKLTNHAPGPRGISLKDGSTVWLNPGQSADIDKKDIAGALPDLGQPRAASASVDAGEIDDLKAKVTELEKQVDALTKERDGLGKDKAELEKQVDALTKPKA